MATTIEVETPEKFQGLWEPARYKVMYGGRGGAKSWNVARILLVMGIQKPIRVLCARELQVSIADSVHKLLSDQIKLLGFDEHYTVLQTSIVGRNGTEFGFAGLKTNTNKIKSFEGVDIVWIEEAATVSKASWDLLIPTIRKPGSEIWMTFNPELVTDETYKRFVLDPPTNALVIPINWRDNPWFTDELRAEKDDLKRRDYNSYLHVWEGECQAALEGAIYEEQLKEADEDGRIGSFPYDRTKPVMTFWDLGYRDKTAIWFVQKQGEFYHLIDFYQNSFKILPWYLQYLQTKGYVYGKHYLPHDGKRVSFDTGLTPEDRFQELGMSVESVPRGTDIFAGIESTRTLFSRLKFDEDKCHEGLLALRQYVWGEGTNKTPKHNAMSHGADALRTFGTAPFVQWESYLPGHASSGKVLSEWDPIEMREDGYGNFAMVS